ncbi:MAG: hypothetical protein Kapaf2KO_02410 [Candidatus Kapaibacteriales bacterium]
MATRPLLSKISAAISISCPTSVIILVLLAKMCQLYEFILALAYIATYFCSVCLDLAQTKTLIT